MRGQEDPTTPAKSDTLNVFQRVLTPVWTSRRDTGQEVSPRDPTNNVDPSFAQRKGRSPACEPRSGCGSPPSSDTNAIPSLPRTAMRLPSADNPWPRRPNPSG